ncbi:MAG TPA: ROK family protein [Rhizomicrobium sp.]|jgi:polyphosphate glucokinase
MAVRKKPAKSRADKVLAIDIGGTGLKAAIVDAKGRFLTERLRVKTPKHPSPAKVVQALIELVAPLTGYAHVSIGFPGYVRDGKVFTAANLGTKLWKGYALAKVMEKKLGKPTRLNNDADVQGLAVIKGKGLELVCTLGTGFGTAWFRDGELMPHMELAHIPIHHGEDFDAYIGEGARLEIGDKAWNKRVKKIIPMLATVMNYDHLYIGGGNAQRLRFKLPKNASTVSNDAGMEGSAFVWHPKGSAKRR